MEKKLYEFKYEVAFSFHSMDQSKATRLDNLIKDRFSTFNYKQRQKDLIGTDGVESFKSVFKYESRIVVVLYRKEWGETKWTRIESDAIKTRGLEHGFDFVIFITVEDKVDLPPWIEPTYIWANLKRYGLKAAADAIERKIVEKGGEKKDLRPTDIAKIIENKKIFIRERDLIMKSSRGVEQANKEISILFNHLEIEVTQLKQAMSIPINYKFIDKKSCSIITKDLTINFQWNNYIWNFLEDPTLTVKIVRPVRDPNPPILVKSFKYEFRYSEAKEFGWVLTDKLDLFLVTPNLVDFILKEFLKIIEANIE